MTPGARFGVLALLAGSASLAAQAASAQEAAPGRFDVGIRGVALFSKGEPANDMMGEGVILRWRIKDVWRLGIAYDTVAFDYETPNKALGIASETVVDGSNDLKRTSVQLERRYDTRRRWDPYWLVGVGLASVDVPNVTGARVGGGTFDIATDADDEVHVLAGGGLRRSLGTRWTLDAALTFEHHSTDYTIVDRVSGARSSIGAHSPYGLTVGVNFGF